jgi:hypothetical protein
MSFIYSQALVAAFSEANYSDTDAYVLSSGSPTPKPCLSHDKTMEPSRLSRFGMTCKLLTESRGAELLTWWREVFLVKTSAQPEKVQELTGNDQECGDTWPGSLAKYDLNTSSWKTAQCLLLGGLEEFSETWPRWGLMRSGECWALDIFQPLTSDKESGFWPTPVKTDGFAVGWCETSINRKEAGETRPSGAHIGTGLKYDRRTFPYLSNGYPNPALTEWLMGWPTKFTDLQPLATDKFLEWRQQHGECSEVNE